MTQIKDLSHQARPDLSAYIDKFVREEQGYVIKAYTAEDVDQIVSRLSDFYEQATVSKRTSYYKEIKRGLKDPEFLADLKLEITRYMDRRPEWERYHEYRQLCEKHGLTPKITANKEKLEARLAKILETGGETQDIG